MIRIGYFLEDRRHEDFIKSLVQRVARENVIDIESTVYSNTGGSRVLVNLEGFFKSKQIIQEDIFIVAVDGNCKGSAERERELLQRIPTEHQTRIVYCVPDPHIERWYLLDLQALGDATGLHININQPSYNKNKDYYKSLLGEHVKQAGSLFGGMEYGDDIARHVNFQQLRRVDPGFGRFIDDLKRRLTP